jgi:hypothetical protein
MAKIILGFALSQVRETIGLPFPRPSPSAIRFTLSDGTPLTFASGDEFNLAKDDEE